MCYRQYLLFILSVNLIGCGSLISVSENTGKPFVPFVSYSPTYYANKKVGYCGIYQGIQVDAEEISSGRIDKMGYILDIPFSFIVGTIALPYTITTFNQCGEYIYSCAELPKKFTRPECLIQDK